MGEDEKGGDMSKSKGKRGSTADFEFGEWPFLDGVPSADAADAARYRWLVAQNEMLTLDSFVVLSRSVECPHCDITWVGSDLDAAIDAAMKAAT